MPLPPETERRYAFGVFEADGRTGELRKQGRNIKLRGRPFDILLLLLARGGDVVSREELRQQLWPADTFVDFDHGLNSAMNRLREALGDSAESPRFIETLPKRGYRFIAPIQPVVPAPVVERAVETNPPQRSPEGSRYGGALWAGVAILAIAAVAAVVYWRGHQNAPAASPGKMTLAVLPFDELSGGGDQDFFADGFTDEMIAELGKLDPERLGVIARTTSRTYRNTKKTIGQIREDLGVDYVLEGSIRRSGNRMRITAELIKTSDMTHLWAETYDRDVADALTIQSEVAMKIAHSLTLALHQPATSTSLATSSSAYDLYLRGRFFRQQATEESTRKAIEFYERAIEADPQYARAYAGMADAYMLLGAPGWEVDRPDVLFGKAQASAERALQMDGQLAEAHAVLALVRLYRWDRPGSEREIREAIRLNPSFAQAHQYYSTTLTTMGRFDEAIAEAKRALELDPLSAPANTTLAIRYYYAGRIDEAAAQFRKTFDVSPEFGIAHWGLAQCARLKGDTATELNELQRAVDLSGNSAYMRAHLAYGLATAGDRGKAAAIQRELEGESGAHYQSPYHLALIANGLGDRAAALSALERALADRSGWAVFLPVEPEFAGMRQSAEFQNLLARVTPAP
jgi:TolB-like protein/DNA-binding winged helix-turn-helix (wHTH) protein